MTATAPLLQLAAITPAPVHRWAVYADGDRIGTVEHFPPYAYLAWSTTTDGPVIWDETRTGAARRLPGAAG